eukprot:798465-Prymnesium_polylepis.1
MRHEQSGDHSTDRTVRTQRNRTIFLRLVVSPACRMSCPCAAGPESLITLCTGVWLACACRSKSPSLVCAAQDHDQVKHKSARIKIHREQHRPAVVLGTRSHYKIHTTSYECRREGAHRNIKLYI